MENNNEVKHRFEIEIAQLKVTDKLAREYLYIKNNGVRTFTQLADELNVHVSQYKKEFAEDVCKAVNSYDSLIEENKMLLEALKDAQQWINSFIEATPSGQKRNMLCDSNIQISIAINKAENKTI